MRNYVLKLQYIGRNFFGFQKQSTAKTVQGELEKALSLILQSDIKVNGAARTDRGVNAINQYVNFYFNREIDTSRLKRKINSILFREGLFVKDFFETDLLFHPRKNVKGKVYAYVLSQDKQHAMFLMPGVYFYNGKMDLNLLNVAINGLKGEHDFSIFANKDRSLPQRNNICNLFDAGIIHRNYVDILYFYGNRFLYHMVRRLVYYLIKASTGNIPGEILRDPFNNDAPYTRQVLPPEPLFLVDVFYKGGIKKVL
jgi:tRNA pseudouridine38-40 synthase